METIHSLAGLASHFETTPINAFLESEPIFDFTTAKGFSITGDLGVRYYISD